MTSPLPHVSDLPDGKYLVEGEDGNLRSMSKEELLREEAAEQKS